MRTQYLWKCLAIGLVWIAAPLPLWILLAFTVLD